MITIQPGSSSRTPLFCVHAEAGDVSLYRDLARYLSPERPVLGLCAPAGDELVAQPQFVELAAFHAHQITQAQPGGPYLIVGECTGGALAYEIAWQLHGAGHDVALLAVIDAFAPGLPRIHALMPQPAYRAVHRTRILGFHLRNLVRFDPSAKLTYAKSKARRASRALGMRMSRITGRSSLSASPQGAFRHALATYSPQPYAGSMIVFRAAKLPFGALTPPELGWAELAGGVAVEVVPGYFTTPISEPQVRTLGERLAQRLDACERATRQSREAVSRAGTHPSS